MMKVLRAGVLVTAFSIASLIGIANTPAQTPAQAPATLPSPVGRGGGPQAPAFVSPEVRSDRRLTFRVFAPEAARVELRSPGDIPGIGGRGGTPPQFIKSSDGVWDTTVGPVPAGAYRYVFVVNGWTKRISRITLA